MVPGFTAEQSLHSRRGKYFTAATFEKVGGNLEPAQMLSGRLVDWAPPNIYAPTAVKRFGLACQRCRVFRPEGAFGSAR